MTTTHTPDKWLLVKYTDEKTGNTGYKVFGSWSGGYLDSDAWRISSQIERFIVVDNYFHFHGASSSTYRCHKEMYGATAYGHQILSMIEKTAIKGVIDVEILFEMPDLDALL